MTRPLRKQSNREPAGVPFDASMLLKFDEHVQLAMHLGGRNWPKRVVCRKCGSALNVLANEAGFISGACERVKEESDGILIMHNLPVKAQRGSTKLTVTCGSCNAKNTIYGPKG
jgi:ribosomal protein L40E